MERISNQLFCLSGYTSDHMSVKWSVCLSVCPFALSVCQIVCLSVCLSVRQHAAVRTYVGVLQQKIVEEDTSCLRSVSITASVMMSVCSVSLPFSVFVYL